MMLEHLEAAMDRLEAAIYEMKYETHSLGSYVDVLEDSVSRLEALTEPSGVKVKRIKKLQSQSLVFDVSEEER